MGIALLVNPRCRYSTPYIEKLCMDDLVWNRMKLQADVDASHQPTDTDPYAQPITVDTDDKAAIVAHQLLTQPPYTTLREPINMPILSRPLALRLTMKANELFRQPPTTIPHKILPILLDAIRLDWIKQKHTTIEVLLHPNIRACMRSSILTPEQALVRCIEEAPEPTQYIREVHIRHTDIGTKITSPWRVYVRALEPIHEKLRRIEAMIMIPRVSATAAAIEWCVEHSELYKEFVSLATDTVGVEH